MVSQSFPGQFVVALLALLVNGMSVPGADQKTASKAQPGRFQYLAGVPQDKLFDTATGRLYLYDKEGSKWFLYAKEPKDLDAEVIKSPMAGRFEYLSRRPQDRLFDSSTGRVYLLDKDERKWFLFIKEPKP